MIVKSNWDTATPEQKNRIIDNVVQGVQTLYRSVVQRYVYHLTYHEISLVQSTLSTIGKDCTFCQKNAQKK